MTPLGFFLRSSIPVYYLLAQFHSTYSSGSEGTQNTPQNMMYSECLPTRLNTLAESNCLSQVLSKQNDQNAALTLELRKLVGGEHQKRHPTSMSAKRGSAGRGVEVFFFLNPLSIFLPPSMIL